MAYAMSFEQVVEKLLGHPKTSIYYAGYWGDNFQTRAILFTICVIIRNNLSPTKEADDKLSAFEETFSSGKSTYNDCVLCLEYLKAFQANTE
ncbi:MAG: hypothetical protein KIT62_11045 [Cyclobacteriaceae bacterium]|nr:hypothetical protein [Cyclobacteriaceae bacterium]